MLSLAVTVTEVADFARIIPDTRCQDDSMVKYVSDVALTSGTAMLLVFNCLYQDSTVYRVAAGPLSGFTKDRCIRHF